ncbi:MAG: response regulator transcription factor [Planctomycetota bacterium]
MTFEVLFVEDDASIRTVLHDALQHDGHSATVAQDGDEALAILRERRFDLLILDVMLPGPSGLEILRSVREHDRRTPILLLTARSSEADKVLGLELGADDYVTKPFGLRELRARIKALLRRREADAPSEQMSGRFAFGDVAVDLAAYELTRAGHSHRLSPTEAAMLELLWRERGRVVDRTMFLDEVWNGATIGDRTIDTHLLHLRKKLENDPKKPRHLVTVHGVGYRLVPDADGGPAATSPGRS